MFGLRSFLQASQSAVARRLVTVACIGLGLVIAVVAVA